MRRGALVWLIGTLIIPLLWAVSQQNRSVTFRFVVDTPAEVVYLAGSFNEWQPRKHPMNPSEDRRTWTLTLQLPPGAHQYKFVVNGTEWHTDPNAPVIDDGNGNLNSVIWVEPDGYQRPARIGDGQITRSAIHHDPADLRDRNPVQGTLNLRLRTRKHDVQAVSLHYWQNGRSRTLRMQPVVSDALYTYYLARLPEADLEYLFAIRDGRTTLWLSRLGLTSQQPIQREARFTHRVGENRFEVPDWVADAIFYQILPDRFYNADPTSDPENDVPIDFTGRIEGDRFYGGDLKGITEKLDYLHELGITTLYLTPIFASVTHHNYDIDDYMRVDPQLGTKEDLEALVQALRKRSMCLVLDGVFNHTGIYFFAFQDLLEHQERSPYRDWFIVERFPVRVESNPNYWAWWNIPYMPKLNHENPAVRRYLLGVVSYWTRLLKLDGWRLDVPNEVADTFWREFRPLVKRANSEAVIIGEIWSDAGHWLQGDMFDSVMNYLWRGAVLDWVAHRRIRASQFDQRMQSLLIRYPRQSLFAMYNMLSSHDTQRFWRECGGDERRFRLGILLQMTAIGAPAIYYGDEIGMDGGGTPDNRRPMKWENLTPQELALRAYVQRLIQVRQAIPALRRGDWQTLLVDDERNLYAFARILHSPHSPFPTPHSPSMNTEIALVLINNGEQDATVEVPSPSSATKWIVVAHSWDTLTKGTSALQRFERKTYSATKGRLALTLPPLSGMILIPTPSKQEVSKP